MTAVPAPQDHQSAGETPLPGAEVLAAFGLHGEPRRMSGGRGSCVRVGDAVLKPVDADPDAVDWMAATMASVTERGFRVARPIPTTQGRWSFDGWTASQHLVGAEPDHRRAPRWDEILATGDAFHRALAHLARPAFLDRRDDPWQLGDHAAWHDAGPHGNEHVIVPGLIEPYEQLLALRRRLPVGRRQLIHGDLTGNVLLAPGLPPAVIDFSPYWRPPAFGAAIVVGDAVLWHGAGADLITRAAAQRGPDFVQFVVRALVYRLVTTNEFTHRCPDDDAPGSEIENYRRAASLLATAVTGQPSVR